MDREQDRLIERVAEMKSRLRANRYEVHADSCNDGDEAVPCNSGVCKLEYEAEVLFGEVEAALRREARQETNESRSPDGDGHEKGAVVDRETSAPEKPTAAKNAGTRLEGAPGKPGPADPRLRASSDVSTVVEALGPVAGSIPADSHQTCPRCGSPDGRLNPAYWFCNTCRIATTSRREARVGQQWQPIETAPREEIVHFWIVPKTADETYRDTSGDPIVCNHVPYLHKGRYASWGALSKATHWMPLPQAPDAAPLASPDGRAGGQPKLLELVLNTTPVEHKEPGGIIQHKGFSPECPFCRRDAAARLAEPPAWRDEKRWQLVEEALKTNDLSDFQKLVAIGSVVNSRKPLTDAEIRRTRELFPEAEPSATQAHEARPGVYVSETSTSIFAESVAAPLGVEGRLEKLIAQWRASRGHDRLVFVLCADELEAALHATGSPAGEK